MLRAEGDSGSDLGGNCDYGEKVIFETEHDGLCPMPFFASSGFASLVKEEGRSS